MDYQCIRTTCPYCAVGCSIYLQILDGEIIGTQPAQSASNGKSSLCIKGLAVHEFVQHPDKLRRPLIKSNGRFAETGWDEALDRSARELQRLMDTYGPESIGFVGSARCTNEESYLFQKLARTIFGHNHIDHCARL
ncbi:MAG: molybdopterin-dependent oxidoreductase [Desulfohalobiaceae bacterium]|nr:molybdopterin-dependent oxidoreductase [Desulfohalobiaceae bacterium]